jgi:hypothetical protein
MDKCKILFDLSVAMTSCLTSLLDDIPEGVQVFDRIADFRKWRRSILMNGETLGYVPTMGALHAGHISLGKAWLYYEKIYDLSIKLFFTIK